MKYNKLLHVFCTLQLFILLIANGTGFPSSFFEPAEENIKNGGRYVPMRKTAEDDSNKKSNVDKPHSVHRNILNDDPTMYCLDVSEMKTLIGGNYLDADQSVDGFRDSNLSGSGDTEWRKYVELNPDKTATNTQHKTNLRFYIPYWMDLENISGFQVVSNFMGEIGSVTGQRWDMTLLENKKRNRKNKKLWDNIGKGGWEWTRINGPLITSNLDNYLVNASSGATTADDTKGFVDVHVKLHSSVSPDMTWSGLFDYVGFCVKGKVNFIPPTTPELSECFDVSDIKTKIGRNYIDGGGQSVAGLKDSGLVGKVDEWKEYVELLPEENKMPQHKSMLTVQIPDTVNLEDVTNFYIRTNFMGGRGSPGGATWKIKIQKGMGKIETIWDNVGEGGWIWNKIDGPIIRQDLTKYVKANAVRLFVTLEDKSNTDEKLPGLFDYIGFCVHLKSAPSPVTPSPITSSPVTSSPITSSPITPSPITSSPVTSSPITSSPITQSPITQSPITPSPVTPSPITPSPVTPLPVTPAPVVVTPSPTKTDDSTCTSTPRIWHPREPELIIDGWKYPSIFTPSGENLDLSSNGRTMAVGVMGGDGKSFVKSGFVRVFLTDDGKYWSQLGQDIDGEAEGDNHGCSVKLSSDGRTLAASAVENSGSGLLYSGHVRVFKFDDNTDMWIQKGSDIDGEEEREFFGHELSLSNDGNTVAIGVQNKDGTGGKVDAGKAVVFNFDGNDWIQLGQKLEGKGAYDNFGKSVALSADGTILAVGAYREDIQGVTHFFRYNGVSWVKHGDGVKGDSRFAFMGEDGLGYTVQLSGKGDMAAIGAIGSGTFVVFKFDGEQWKQIGNRINLNLGWKHVISGSNMAFSSNGCVLVVGTLTGFGNYAGKIHIFSYDGIDWVKQGESFKGEICYDEFGGGLATSDDGSIIAAAPAKSSYVRVYDVKD